MTEEMNNAHAVLTGVFLGLVCMLVVIVCTGVVYLFFVWQKIGDFPPPKICPTCGQPLPTKPALDPDAPHS